jgi:hypothetical protein
MEVTFTIEVRLPEVKIESIDFDEWGNAEISLSAGLMQARCRMSAAGNDHASLERALLSLAGLQISNRNAVIFKCPKMSDAASLLDTCAGTIQ